MAQQTESIGVSQILGLWISRLEDRECTMQLDSGSALMVGGLLTVSHHFVWSSQFKGCWRSVKFQESGYGYISYCYITTTGKAGGLPSNV